MAKAKRKRVRRSTSDTLNKIQDFGPWPNPLAVVVHGPPGVGKSEFAAAFPDPAFIIDPHEYGINDLVAYKRADAPKVVHEVSTWKDLLAVENLLPDLDSQGVKTLVFDSMTGMEKLCHVHHCEQEYDGDWSKSGFLSYQQGPKGAAKIEWPLFLSMLNEARKLEFNIILIAHTEVKPYSNPDGPDYDRHTPYMEKSTWQQISRWAQAILFYNFHHEIEKKGPKAKAHGSPERYLYTDWAPAYDAKNRFGLDPVIEAGDSGKEAYAAFCRAF